MSKATVDTITITVGKHKLTLTLEEAKALRETLNDVLGKRETIFPYYPTERTKFVPVPMPYPVRDHWTRSPWDNGPICTGTPTTRVAEITC